MNDQRNQELKIVGYRHTGIIVKNLSESLIFYRDVLGLKVIQEHIDSSEYISTITGLEGLIAEYAKLEIPGGSVLELLMYPSHILPKKEIPIYSVGEAHLAFSVESADKAHSYLSRLGIPCLSRPVVSSEKIAKVFFCLDPDNYRVEIVEMINLHWPQS